MGYGHPLRTGVWIHETIPEVYHSRIIGESLSADREDLSGKTIYFQRCNSSRNTKKKKCNCFKSWVCRSLFLVSLFKFLQQWSLGFLVHDISDRSHGAPAAARRAGNGQQCEDDVRVEKSSPKWPGASGGNVREFLGKFHHDLTVLPNPGNHGFL